MRWQVGINIWTLEFTLDNQFLYRLFDTSYNLASMLKLLLMVIIFRMLGEDALPRRCPILNTLYISLQSVSLCSWWSWTAAERGKVVFDNRSRLSPTKCSTFGLRTAEQCTIPWISGRSASSSFLTTGAYVRVGESTSFRASSGLPSTLLCRFQLPLYQFVAGTALS